MTKCPMHDYPAHDYPSGAPRSLELDPVIDQIRHDRGVGRVQLPHGKPCWLVTGYDDVRAIYTRDAFSRADMGTESAPRLTSGLLLQGAIGGASKEDHTRMRRAMLRELDGQRLHSLGEQARRTMTSLLQDISAVGRGDYVAQVARPYAMTVLCNLLGIPEDDGPALIAWVEVLLADNSWSDASDTPSPEQAITELGAYVMQLIRDRRTHPTTDLVSALIGQPDPLNTYQLATLICALVMGGIETTAHMLSKMLLRLLSQRELWNRLCHNPELSTAAVEELLRTIAIAGGGELPWRIRRPVTLAGVTMAAGDYVVPAVGAANRDPAVFAQPDTIQFERAARPHLTFGHAGHFCLGAQIARIELQVAIATISRDYPATELAIPIEAVPWQDGTSLWQLAELPLYVRSA